MVSTMRRWLSAALAAVVAAGCSHGDESRFGRLRVTESTQSVWRHSPAPPNRGPAIGVEGVAFLDEQHGFLVASSAPDRAPPVDVGRIQETRDGGSTWRSVWSERNVSLHAVAFADRWHGFVAGSRRGPGRNLLLRTSDGGQSWTALRPRLPRRARDVWPTVVLDFPSPLVGYAITDPHSNAYGLGWMLRTTDGGRTWHELAGPRDVLGAYAVDFVDDRNGFAVGAVAGCAGGVWRTRDRGASWSPLPASCGEVFSVDFLDARTGFTAGGNPYYVETPPWQVVRRTGDGGRSWTRLYVDARRRNPGTNPIVELLFSTRRIGYGATGGCKGGQNAPCGGALLVTRDGGRRWRDTGVAAMDVAAVGTSAWAVPACTECGVLWRTRDAGRTWTSLAGPGGPYLKRLELSGSRLTLVTDAGVFSRREGTRRWRREPASWYDLADDAPGPVANPPVDPWAVAFADARRGYLAGDPVFDGGLFATDDRGHTWRRLRPPFRADTISAAPGLVVLSAWSERGAGRVAFSEDGGGTWLVRTPPSGASCTPTAAVDRTAWLVCLMDTEPVRTALLRSDDAGRTWTRLGVVPAEVERVVGPAGNAWAVGGGLWHSSDGGRSWTERWPRLPTPG